MTEKIVSYHKNLPVHWHVQQSLVQENLDLNLASFAQGSDQAQRFSLFDKAQNQLPSSACYTLRVDDWPKMVDESALRV